MGHTAPQLLLYTGVCRGLSRKGLNKLWLRTGYVGEYWMKDGRSDRRMQTSAQMRVFMICIRWRIRQCSWRDGKRVNVVEMPE
jgi:hypothetical protein